MIDRSNSESRPGGSWPACWRPVRPPRSLALPGCDSHPHDLKVTAAPARPVSETLAVRAFRRRPGRAATGAGRDPVRLQLGALQRLRREVSIHQAARRCKRTSTSPTASLTFPSAPCIAKTFAYPRDAREPFRRPPADRNPDLEARSRRLGRVALRLERGAIRSHARRGR